MTLEAIGLMSLIVMLVVGLVMLADRSLTMGRWLAIQAVSFLAFFTFILRLVEPPEPNLSVPWVAVKCLGRFEELGLYQGVVIKCEDGREWWFKPNKYTYSRIER